MSQNEQRDKYVYGYDLYSESVRQYTSITDMKTIKGAIGNNIYDYIMHLGAFEPAPKFDRGQVVKYVLLGTAAVMAGVLQLTKDFLEQQGLLNCLLIGFAATVTFGVYMCENAQRVDDLAFTCTCVPATMTRDKDYIKALHGRRLRICVAEVPDTAKLSLEAQLVGPTPLFGSPHIHYSVSKVVPYGRYFSKSGFFYPPSLVTDVDGLLNSLRTSASKKKQ